MVDLTAGLKGLSMSRIRFIIVAAIFVSALVLVPASPASAHSPLFPKNNHDPTHAYQIDDPAKSWVIYATLDHADEGDYYKFTVSEGDKIQIGLMAADSPSVSGFLPSFVLMIPGWGQKTNLPSYVEVPAGYGTMVVDGQHPGRASYEPFSPGWLYDLADLTIDAPTGGTYYVAVYDNARKTGNYGLPIGYVESFTPAEWLMIPYYVHTTYVWEGQNLFVTYLPLILTIAIGGIILYRRSGQGKAPKAISKWAAAVAGLSFLGTAVGILYQMILAMIVTGLAVEAVFTLIFVAIGVVLSVPTLLYGIREKPALTMGRRLALVLIGTLALVGWAGFLLGTALAILAAVVPPYATTKE